MNSMKCHRRGLLAALIALLTGGMALSQGGVHDEEQGIDPPRAGRGLPGPLPGRSFGEDPRPVGATVLLIPESSNDRVMAFDPTTGDLIDADFIPADPDHLSTPIHAILGPAGNSILVSDQIEDAVLEYDLDGNYLGVFAPAGGPDTSILDNIRGISLRPNGNLLVSVGGGANDDAIAEFDTSGNYVGNFVANGDGGLDSPFDVYVRMNDVLVGGITSDAIHRYDLDGNYLGDFSPIDSFPEQIAEAGNGNVLVGNFSGTETGVVEYLPDGTFVAVYDPPELGGNRGAFELGNGNILTTNGSGVHEIDRNGNLVETKFSGVSARFIELVALGECFLLLGEDRGGAPFDSGSHVWDTHLTKVDQFHAVTLEDNPPIPVPSLPWTFCAQVVMWNPKVFPDNPEQFSNGIEFTVLPDGSIETIRYGEDDGMEVHAVTVQIRGEWYVQFPFSIDGIE